MTRAIACCLLLMPYTAAAQEDPRIAAYATELARTEQAEREITEALKVCNTRPDLPVCHGAAAKLAQHWPALMSVDEFRAKLQQAGQRR